MEESKKNSSGNGMCSTCHASDMAHCMGCWIGKRRMVKLIAWIVILGFVFLFGMMLGELKGYLRSVDQGGFSSRSMYGRGSMMRSYYDNPDPSYYGGNANTYPQAPPVR